MPIASKSARRSTTDAEFRRFDVNVSDSVSGAKKQTRRRMQGRRYGLQDEVDAEKERKGRGKDFIDIDLLRA